jgi:phage FluMu protein Com
MNEIDLWEKYGRTASYISWENSLARMVSYRSSPKYSTRELSGHSIESNTDVAVSKEVPADRYELQTISDCVSHDLAMGSILGMKLAHSLSLLTLQKSFENLMLSDNVPGGPGPSLPATKTLRCLACDKIKECSSTELLHYTKTKWPRCCGEVMVLDTPTNQAGNESHPP